jgi:hypothetical protein
MIKRAGITGLALAAALALGGLRVSSASAVCYRVEPGDIPGNFSRIEFRTCQTPNTSSGLYVNAIPRLELTAIPSLWCAELATANEKLAGRMYYTTNKCEAKAVTGNFIKILLPLLSIGVALEGETYPIIGEGSVAAAKEGEIALETEVSKLPAESVSVLMTASELTTLGAINLRFAGVHENSKAAETCNSEGDAAGVVLVSGEFYLVFTSVEPNTLEAGTVISFPSPLSITCKGGLKVKVEPPSVVKIKAAHEADIEKFEITWKCTSPGEQEQSSYLVEAGEEFTTELLKVNFGLGKENGCEEVKSPITITRSSASAAKMFSILY